MSGECIVSRIYNMPRVRIFFEPVEAPSLQFVSVKFLHEADVTSSLLLVAEYPCTLFRTYVQLKIKLLALITLQRENNICRALRADAPLQEMYACL